MNKEADTMSDPEMARTGPHRPVQGRRRAHRPISLEGLPTAEDLAASPHKGDDADRFSLYTPEQVEAETRNVRLDMSFEEVISVRDQAEMVIACMQQIIRLTRNRDIGSVRQRIDCRREAAGLGAALKFFNGRTPYGYKKKKRPQG
jgi:hypothetical protein